MGFLAETKVPGSVPALTSLGLKPSVEQITGRLAAPLTQILERIEHRDAAAPSAPEPSRESSRETPSTGKSLTAATGGHVHVLARQRQKNRAEQPRGESNGTTHGTESGLGNWTSQGRKAGGWKHGPARYNCSRGVSRAHLAVHRGGSVQSHARETYQPTQRPRGAPGTRGAGAFTGKNPKIRFGSSSTSSEPIHPS